MEFSFFLMTKQIIKYKLIGIEIWGNNKIKPFEIQNLLKIKIGDFYNEAKIEKIKKQAEKILKNKYPLFGSIMMPRYKQEKITCLSVDFINPKSTFIKRIKPNPQKNIIDSKSIFLLYNKYQKELIKCFSDKKRSVGIIYEKSYSFSKDRKLRKYQEKFIILAEKNYYLLINIIKNDKNIQKRAAAIYILGWHPDRKMIIKDLENSFYDSNFEVQNNAALSLIPILQYSLETKSFNVPIEPIFDLIRMPSGLTRNKALALLSQFVFTNKYLGLIKKRVYKIIKKMAESKQLNHSCFAKPMLKILSKNIKKC